MRISSVLSSAWSLAVVLAACAAPTAEPLPPLPPPPVVSGLREIASEWVDDATTSAGHLRELVVDGDLVLAADANGLPFFGWDGDAEALTRLHAVEPERVAHCSTVALHAPSRTLLCAAPDELRLSALVDVTDPSAPVSRAWPRTTPLAERVAVLDLAVDGDTLWLAALDAGLVRATLGPDGTPGDLEAIPSGADVVQVAVSEGRVVYLDRVEGLVVLDALTLARLGSAPLLGPPIDLAVDGARVVVSLGSEGVVGFALDAAGRPQRILEVQPRCVATGADLEGDALAVACLTGLTLYDLTGESPREAGFVPALFGMLDVVFAPFGLVVADWRRVVVYATNLDGAVAVPEAPRGMRLGPGVDAHVPVRNPGSAPLEVAWTLFEGARARQTGTLELAPRDEVVLELPSAWLEQASSTLNRTDVVFEVPGSDLETRTRLWQRRSTDDPRAGRVGIGDSFPALARTSPAPTPEVLPVTGEPTLVVFVTVDCYLQWPQLEDLAWSGAHGTGAPSPTVFVLTYSNLEVLDSVTYLRPFGADALLAVEWADYQGSVLGVESEPVPIRAFERSFMSDLPGADFPHDYLVDAEGVVVTTSRAYRGRWPLGE